MERFGWNQFIGYGWAMAGKSGRNEDYTRVGCIIENGANWIKNMGELCLR